MRNQKRWRVRVVRKVEGWVDVDAETSLQAECRAASIPNIIHVYSGSTISGDKPVGQIAPVGVLDEDEYQA